MSAPTLLQAVAVASGAAGGALVRWQAGLRFGVQAGLPMGTLAVNLLGGLAIGVALAWFRLHPEQTVLRCLLVVGFLGGLTTFSAFSGESLSMITEGRFGLALAHSAAHVLGALLCASVGLTVGRWAFAA